MPTRKQDSFNIALIGGGRIGSRHLQGLASLDLEAEIVVIEPNEEAHQRCRTLLEEIRIPSRNQSISFRKNVADLPSRIDLCIVATGADCRAEIVRHLLREKEIRYFILEKVVFQNSKDFIDIIDQTDRRKIKTWVNCPMGIFPFYQELRTQFHKYPPIHYTVQGTNWGLACNAVHYFAHMASFTGIYEYKMISQELDPEIFESKRKGFFEFSGSLKAEFLDKSTVTLQASRENELDYRIQISCEQVEIMIDELRGTAKLKRQANQWKDEELKVTIPFQSEMTKHVSTEILKKGNCGLPTLRQAFFLHQPLLETLIQHVERMSGQRPVNCPIT